MRKISILIASYDEMYNEALAAAFMDINKNISVTAVPFEDLKHKNSVKLEDYDAILIEEVPKGSEVFRDRIMFFSEKKEGGAHHKGKVYKYQNSKNIFDLVYETTIKDSYKAESSSLNKYEKDAAVRKALSVGIVCLGESEACCSLGMTMAKALAYSGRKTLYFDFSEFQRDESMIIKKEGNRSWDDLIYCCVYGKNENLLLHPEDHASVEDSGLMFFKNSKGRNPFCDLNEEETDKMWRILKERLKADIYLCSMNYDNVQKIMKAVGYFNIIIISGGERDINACEDLKKKLTINESFFGEILTVYCGAKQKNDECFDFSVFSDEDVSVSGTEPFVYNNIGKDILRISSYIDRNRKTRD